MNKGKVTFKTLLVGFLATAFLSLGIGFAVLADGNGSTEAGCINPTVGSITGTDSLVVYVAPIGNVITGVCIKSGSNMFLPYTHSGPLGNGIYENGCYTVSGVGTQTVTVIKNFGGSSCQGISHLDIFYGDPGASPTPTPTATPTPTPTATPTDSPTPTPTENPSPTPTDNGTPTPTPTEEPEESPTPTPTVLGTTDVCANIDGDQTSVPEGLHLDASGKNCVSFELGGPSDPGSSTQGQVLGASTLAATGSIGKDIYFILLSLGMLLLSAGIMTHAPQKVKRN